jgi:uncharacterized damage-inducible protein DinB
MNPAQLIDDYLAGPQKLRAAVAGMTAEQLDARPIPGKWSTKQVICHLADFEPVYVDRMKRVIAENEPTMFSGDPDLFATAGLRPAGRAVELDLHRIGTEAHGEDSAVAEAGRFPAEGHPLRVKGRSRWKSC